MTLRNGGECRSFCVDTAGNKTLLCSLNGFDEMLCGIMCRVGYGSNCTQHIVFISYTVAQHLSVIASTCMHNVRHTPAGSFRVRA